MHLFLLQNNISNFIAINLSIGKSFEQVIRTILNCKNGKIIISGVNPHSGENGSIGDEEIKIIKPVIKKLKTVLKKILKCQFFILYNVQSEQIYKNKINMQA